MNDVILDDEIVANKLGGIGIVRMNAAHFGRCEIDFVKVALRKPCINGCRIKKIEIRAVCDNGFNSFCLQPSAYRRTYQPLMAGNKTLRHNSVFLFVKVKGLITSFFDQRVTLRGFMVDRNHFFDQIGESCCCFPAQLFPGL